MATPIRALPDAESDAAKRRNSLKWMQTCLSPNGDGQAHRNVAEELSVEERARIGVRAVREFDADKVSRADWEGLNELGLNLAKQVIEKNTGPWPDSSCIKYPLITTASMQFAARAYPEIIKGTEVVKARVIGADPDGTKQMRANRISEHMSWQCTEEMQTWEEDMDRLLHVLPISGICFKKTYFDGEDRINRSDLCLPNDVIVHYRTKSMELARRITHVIEYYRNDVYERIANGTWLDVKLPSPQDPEHPDDYDAPHVFYEQHRYLDLDGDGYDEPYIVTVHKDTMQVVRIFPRFDFAGVDMIGEKIMRIRPIHYFTKFPFIPPPDGSFYDLGFGILLYPINAAINGSLNQLLDSGTLANLQAGWIDRSLREKGGELPFKPGEWRKTETKIPIGQRLTDKIVPLPTKEPSVVLFQLLGLLIEAGREIGTIKDILSGTPPGANVPATTILALIEQGLKVFGSIHKRIFRASGQEYKKLYRLNSIYLDPEKHFKVLDEPKKVFFSDYNTDDFDIVPVADPNMSSDVQRIATAQATLQTISGRPNVNEDEVTRRLMIALKLPDVEKLIIPPDQRQPPPPPPEVAIEMERVKIEAQKVQIDAARLELEKFKMVSGLEEMQARIAKFKADAIERLAEAESKEAGMQMDFYMAQFKELSGIAKEKIKAIGAVEQAKETSRGVQAGGSKAVED